MTITKEQKVGLFFLGGIVLFAGFIELTVGTGLFGSTYSVFAEFRDVQGLAPGANVRVGGIPAGSVRGVRLSDDRVRVEIAIDRSIPVRSDAVATLDFQALSGARFVAIDLGSPTAPVLEDGATIASEEPAGISSMVVELERLASNVNDLALSLNENQKLVFASLNGLLEENRESIRATMKGLGELTQRLDRGEGTLGKLLHDPALYDRAVSTLAVVEESFGDIRKITRRIAAGEGSIGRLVYDEEIFDDLRETVAGANETIANFEELSIRIVDGEGTVGRIFADDELYVEARDTLRNVNRATQTLEDQAPISVFGTLLGTLF